MKLSEGKEIVDRVLRDGSFKLGTREYDVARDLQERMGVVQDALGELHGIDWCVDGLLLSKENTPPPDPDLSPIVETALNQWLTG